MQLEITRETGAASETLWATVRELGVRQALGHSVAPFVCGVSFKPRDSNIVPPLRSVASSIDCGDPKTISWIGIDEDTLRIGGTEIKVPPGSFIVHEKIVQPLPPARECDQTLTPHILVSIARLANAVYLQVPALGVNRQLFEFNAGEPLSCTTTALRLARRMDFGCVISQFQTRSVHLAIQQNVLFVENAREAQIDGLVIRTRFGIELPCNAELKFQGFDFRSPRYHPLPDHCQGECWIVQDACQRHCAERFSDDQGKLTDAGSDCDHACELGNERCTKHCSPTGMK